MGNKKHNVLAVALEPKQLAKVTEVMAQFQISKSAAARMIFDRAIGDDLTNFVSRESLKAHYNMINSCYDHLSIWIKLECMRLLKQGSGLQEIAQLPDRLAEILGTPKIT